MLDLDEKEKAAWDKQGWTSEGAAHVSAKELAEALGIPIGRAASIIAKCKSGAPAADDVERAIAGDTEAQAAVGRMVRSLPWVVLRNGKPDLAESRALVKDLKQRGLLESTVVVWGGEFGRTPMNEARNGSTFLGRDHHARAFTMWFAGAGIKKGVTLGATDELGYNPVEAPLHVHDLHATLLHLMGLEHTKLTYRFQGRDFRLTDVAGNLYKPMLA